MPALVTGLRVDLSAVLSYQLQFFKHQQKQFSHSSTSVFLYQRVPVSITVSLLITVAHIISNCDHFPGTGIDITYILKEKICSICKSN